MDRDKPMFECPNNHDHEATVKQEFKLFIKASSIDKETRGSCPVCQHWFMVAYLIAQKQSGVNFSVYTVQEGSPPQEFVAWSKKFPVVLPVNCTDKKGALIGCELKDTFDELEKFFEAINIECRELKRHNIENSEAITKIETFYSTLNHFLTGNGNNKMLKALKTLDDDLSNEYKFFIDNELAYVDCFLLPRLQHVKVALKRYADMDIPLEFKNVWRYLREAYKEAAFTATMPSDQDIVMHYAKKVPPSRQLPKVTTEKFTYDTSIPESILNESNGEQQKDSDPMEQQSEQDFEQPQAEQHAEDNGVNSEELSVDQEYTAD